MVEYWGEMKWIHSCNMHQHDSSHNNTGEREAEHQDTKNENPISIKFKTRQSQSSWLEARIAVAFTWLGCEGCFWDTEMFCLLTEVLVTRMCVLCESSSSYICMTVHCVVYMLYWNKSTLYAHSGAVSLKCTLDKHFFVCFKNYFYISKRTIIY